MASDGEKKLFTLNSFTQNLASVLADNRTKPEANVFFTRQWGEQFVPRKAIKDTAPTIPNVSPQQFRQYLATTAKNHRHYVRTRRLLRRVLNRHSEQRSVHESELPEIFYSLSFNLEQPHTFEAIFLEPRGESDPLLPDGEDDQRHVPSTSSAAADKHSLGRPGSYGSLSSLQSLQNNIPTEAAGGRLFRAHQTLNNRLESYHDTVSTLLSSNLTNSGDDFWRTVNSYGAFHSDIEEAIHQTVSARQRLKKAKGTICDRSEDILKLQYARDNRQFLLARLYDIACLRDAQATVQMLLNQDDFPKALECITTAQEVLSTELRGVHCFRHLSNQLDEMTKAIAKMLLEQFVAIIQKEFAKPIENESECGYQEGQLNPVIIGLLQCREFSFIQMLRCEIVEAIKSTIRRILKNIIITNDSCDLVGLDPSNMAERLNKLKFEQWMDVVCSVLNALYLFCRRVMSIQELILESSQSVQKLQRNLQKPRSSSNLSRSRTPQAFCRRKASISSLSSIISLPTHVADHISEEDRNDSLTSGIVVSKSETVSNNSSREQLEKPCETPDNRLLPFKRSETLTILEETSSRKQSDSNPTSTREKYLPFGAPGSILAMQCHDLNRVREIIPFLIDHTITTCEERISKLINARSKDNVLATDCDPFTFNRLCKMITEFIERCQAISISASKNSESTKANGTITENDDGLSASISSESPLNGLRSPLMSIMQQQTVKFQRKFFEERRQELGRVLDSELWQESELPNGYQKLMDKFELNGRTLCNLNQAEEYSSSNETGSERDISAPRNYIMLGGEKYSIIGASLLLFKTIAEYCDLLDLFPQCCLELLTDVIELFKNFNSRSCQLILGTGAIQLVGLKTISVKNLALASRSLQFVLQFIQVTKDHFASRLPVDRHNSLRHFDKVQKDYNDHIEEIKNKLEMIMETHIIGALQEWKTEGKSPTQAFQQIVKHIGKFYSVYSSVMPISSTADMLHRLHRMFKLYLKQHVQSKGITPHDALAWGMANADFDYYMENIRAFPDCKNFSSDTLSDVLQRTAS